VVSSSIAFCSKRATAVARLALAEEDQHLGEQVDAALVVGRAGTGEPAVGDIDPAPGDVGPAAQGVDAAELDGGEHAEIAAEGQTGPALDDGQRLLGGGQRAALDADQREVVVGERDGPRSLAGSRDGSDQLGLGLDQAALGKGVQAGRMAL
jgi:hypothetical protein